MTIDDIIWKTIKNVEGGYSNHPLDKGGETNYGITEKVARANGYTGDMISMGISWAFQIYKNVYFFKPKLNQVYLLSENIAHELFDTGINVGTETAIKFLQQSLNLLNYNGKLYPDMIIDGIIGTVTLNAIKKVLDHSPRGEEILLKALNGFQFMWYHNICKNNPSQEIFINGWILNRIN